MSWPYIDKQIVNMGSPTEPDFKEMPKLVWISGNRGPYQECRDCRDLRAANDKVKVGFCLPGSSRCLKHSARYYRDLMKSGDIDPDYYLEKIAFLESQELIHQKQRMGAYYKEEEVKN